MFGKKKKEPPMSKAVVCVQDFQTGKQIYCEAAETSQAFGLYLAVKRELEKNEKPNSNSHNTPVA